MKFDLARKSKILDVFNLGKIWEGHCVGMKKKNAIGSVWKKFKKNRNQGHSLNPSHQNHGKNNTCIRNAGVKAQFS